MQSSAQRTSQRSLFLLRALAILLGISYWSFGPFDPDLGWQLFGGKWIAEHGELPSSDPINSFAGSWHNYHWLSQIFFYQMFSHGGYEGLRVAFGLVMSVFLLTVLEVFHLASHGRARPVLLALVFALSITLIHQVVSIRPQILSLTAIAASLLILQREKPFELLLLLLIAIISANIHVYWIFIPYMWLALRCLPRLLQGAPYSAVYAWGGLFLLCLAGLISPYGILGSDPSLFGILRNYSLIWDYLHLQPAIAKAIGEFKSSLAVRSFQLWIFLAFIVLAARSYRRKDWAAYPGQLVLLLTAVLLAIKSIKFIALLPIFSAPILFIYLGRVTSPAVKDMLRTGERAFHYVLLLSLIVVTAFAVRYNPYSYRNVAALELLYPSGPCGRLADLPLPLKSGRDHLRVLTEFDHGGWCKWFVDNRDPRQIIKVTTDNRTQGVPEEHYVRSFDLFQLRGNWLATLERWAPDAIVVSKLAPLSQVLALSPNRWRMEMQDTNFALFTPVGSRSGE